MQAITEQKRDALLRKLQALSQKTVQNGCTEAEAAAAAEVAGELMETYGLSMDDIKLANNQEELCQRDHYQSPTKRTHEVQYTCAAIANWCHCKVWHHGNRIVYFGLVADVQVAKYLTQVFQTAMDFEWKRHWTEYKSIHGGVNYGAGNPRSARKAFMLGMALRLRDRLYNMAQERTQMEQERVSNDCRALILVKAQIVQKAYDELGLQLGSAKKRSYEISSHQHYGAGKRAGDKVNITGGGLDDRAQHPRLG